MRAQWEGGDGRILLGDDTGGGTVVLRPIMFRCAGVLISRGFPCTSTYIVDTMYTQFGLGAKFDFVRNLADRNYCVSLGVSLRVCMYPKNVIRKHRSCAKCVVKIDFRRGSRGKYPSILHPTKREEDESQGHALSIFCPPSLLLQPKDSAIPIGWDEVSVPDSTVLLTATKTVWDVRLAWVWQRTVLVIRRHVTRKTRTSLWEKPYNFIQRLRQQIPPKRRYLCTKLFDVTFRKTSMDQTMKASLAGSG